MDWEHGTVQVMKMAIDQIGFERFQTAAQRFVEDHCITTGVVNGEVSDTVIRSKATAVEHFARKVVTNDHEIQGYLK